MNLYNNISNLETKCVCYRNFADNTWRKVSLCFRMCFPFQIQSVLSATLVILCNNRGINDEILIKQHEFIDFPNNIIRSVVFSLFATKWYISLWVWLAFHKFIENSLALFMCISSKYYMGKKNLIFEITSLNW